MGSAGDLLTAYAKRAARTGAGITGVELLEALGTTTHSAVHRAVWRGRIVAVKRPLQKPHAGDGALDLLAREASSLSRIRHPAVLRVLDAGQCADGSPYLLSEFVDGESLAARIARGPLPVDEVRTVMRGVAGALEATHRAGLVHRDVTPGNIMIGPDGEPTLIDFALAAAEQQGPDALARAVGTFHYTSPEQAGMLRVGIDGRADLYSLGAVAFECLTGKPPFTGSTVDELLQEHTRREAPAVDELRPETPAALAAIVARLLRKDPDDRYPTAASLRHDLEQLPELAGASVLARSHRDPRLCLRTPFAGRERELAELRSWAAAARAGSGAAHCILARPRDGLTRMGLEYVAMQQAAGAVAVWAQCAPGGAPLSVVHAWLGQLVEAIEHLESGGRSAVCQALAEELGSHAPALGATFPQLAPILEAAPCDQGPIVQSERAFDLLARAIAHLSNHLPSLTLVLDDGEHLDGASASVLRRLCRLTAEHPLTLLLLTHDPESALLAELRQRATGDLVLQSLTDADAHGLLAGFLQEPELDRALSSRIVARAGTGPAALLDYTRSLLDGVALTFDARGLRLDLDRVRALDLPEDVADLAIARAGAFEAGVRAILGIATLQDGAFSIDDVVHAGELKSSEVILAVRRAQGARLVHTAGDNRFAFVDGRVAAFLAEELDDSTVRRAHARLAQRIDLSGGDDSAIFRAAAHQYRGAEASTARAAVDLNLRAGRRAMEQVAWDEARTCLQRAHALCERFELPIDASLLADLGTVHANGGNAEQGFRFYEQAIECCDDVMERAELSLHLAELYMSANFDVDRMEVNLARCWEAIGSRLPGNTPWHIFGYVGYWLLTFVMVRTGFRVGSAADKRRARFRAQLMEVTLKWAYFKNHVYAVLGLSFRGYHAALLMGTSPELASAHASHAATLATMGLPPAVSDRAIERGAAIARELDDPVALTRVHYWAALCDAQRGHMGKSADALQALLAERGHLMPINDYFFAAIDVSVNLTARGHKLRASAFLERCLEDLVTRSGTNGSEARMCRDLLLGNRASDERPVEALADFDARVEAMDASDEGTFNWFQVWTLQLALRLEVEDSERYDEAIDNGEKARRSPMFAGWQFSLYWVLKGFCRIEQAWVCEGAEFERRLQQARQVLVELKVLAKYPFVAAQRDMIQAGVTYLEGDFEEAIRQLAQAEAGAVTSDNLLARFYVLRLRARMLAREGQDAAAVGEAQLAVLLAEKQGWTHRARQLRRQFGHGFGATARTGGVVADGTRMTSSAESRQMRRDRDALLDVSQATAAVREPGEQAAIALDRLLVLLGGERAVWCSVEGGEVVGVDCVRSSSGDEDLPEEEDLHTLWRRVLDDRKVVVVNGNAEIEQHVGLGLVQRGVRSLICAPVLLRDEPVGVVTLDSRVTKGAFTDDDAGVLAAVATQIAIAQQTARFMQRELERQALDKDVQLTAAVQALLLPADEHLRVGGVEALGFFEPAAQAAGDFWYAERTAEGRLRVLVADVTGHGAGSAMVTALLAGCYRTERNRDGLTTQTLLENLDRTLCAVCGDAYQVPFCAVELDPDSGEGQVWSGAAPPVLIRNTRGEVRWVGAPGLPIGDGQGVAEAQRFQLQPGELLWMFSDGLSELPLPNGTEFGLRRLRNALSCGPAAPLHPIREHLLREVRGTADMARREDDITFVLVQRTAGG